MLVIGAVSSSKEEEDANLDEENEVQKRGLFEVEPEADSKVYNAFQNYRRLLKSQRWKKSKMEMYRPAYGFGKRSNGALMNFRMLTPFDFYSRQVGNPYSYYLATV